MKNLPKVVYDIVYQEAKKLALIVEEIVWEQVHNDYFLRIIADTDTGISVEELSDLNEQISLALDEVDPIDTNYFLEVSSPGIERPLKTKADFIRYLGSYVCIKTYQRLDGAKEFYGTLLEYNDEELILETMVKQKTITIKIKLANISLARLAIKF